MTETKRTFEPVTYKGAGHGFMRHEKIPPARKQIKRLATTPGFAGRRF